MERVVDGIDPLERDRRERICGGTVEKESYKNLGHLEILKAGDGRGEGMERSWSDELAERWKRKDASIGLFQPPTELSSAPLWDGMGG